MTADPFPVGPLLLTSREAAKSLSISERTLFSLRKAGAIRAVKVGPVGLRFSIAELQRFIAEREAESVVAESDGAA